MKKLIIPFLLFFSLFNTGLNAQTFTNYTSNNSGLNYNGLNNVIIDKYNTKWFGSDIGFSKFDGVNWTNYTIADNSALYLGVKCIAIDSLGNKWIGTAANGIIKFDGINWTIYDTTNSNLTSNAIFSIAVDHQGNIWAGSSHSISKFNGTNWVNYIPINPINSITTIAIEPLGNHSIWFGGGTSGILKYDGTNWTSYTQDNTGVPHLGCNSIAFDLENNVWATIYGAEGVFHFNGLNWIRYFDSTYTNYYNTARLVVIDELNYKWFTGIQFGLSIPSSLFNLKDTSWRCYNYTNNIPFANAVSIAMDSIGNIWLATVSDGLWKLDCFPPTTPTVIIGSATVTQGQGLVTYNVPPIDYVKYYVWSFPNGFTGTSTTNSITVDIGTNAVSGNINVYGHSNCGNGNPATLNITVLNGNGIEESLTTTYLNITPNPTTNNLTIETNSNTNQSLEITNLIGQSIYTSTVNKKKTIDVSNFPKGIYILKLNTDKGIVVKKFVKE